jgi:hypothetical protein
MSDAILKVDEFVRSVRVNRNSPHALFLGAGSSLSSGVPSAGSCIDEWKRDIFVTNNSTLRDHVAEITLPSVLRRIDNWLKQNGYWPDEDEDDYSYFIEKCLPIADDRRKFFEPWIRNARPHVGYQLVCLLAEAQVIRSVWTTNFDGLTARACAATSVTPVEVGHDCQERLFRQPSSTELVCVSLHGDYRYDKLKNTDTDLQQQEEQLRKSLADTLKTDSLIVCGYSGRDGSVMAALEEAVTASPPISKIYWCGYSEEPTDDVAQLIAKAKTAGRDAFYVPGADFDDLMARLASSCISGEVTELVKEIIGSAENNEMPDRQSFESFDGSPTGLIKSNAFPLKCPSEVFAFDLVEWPEKQVWKWLAERALPHNVIAAPFKKVLAFGTLDGIQSAFDGCIDGTVQRVPISEKDYRYEDGAVMSLLRQALVRAIAGKLQLDTDGKEYVWEPESFKTEQQSGKSYRVHRCVGVGIRPVGERLYLTVNPTFHVPADDEDDKTDSLSVKKKLLGYQHNKEYNEDLNYWRAKLRSGSQQDEVRYDYPCESAAFEFVIDPKPAYATITSSGSPVDIPDSVTALVHHRGMAVKEPKLLFATSGGWQPGSDTMPLRGLSSHGPFDLPLSSLPMGESIRISVVCPQPESAILETFLQEVTAKWEPKRGSREEYLVPYPGFQAAFRVPIDLPRRSDVRWVSIPEIDSSLDERAGALTLSRNICDAIKSLTARDRSVVLIMTPQRWGKWRRYATTAEEFDVHHFVKAYAVQRGVATQFLTQEKMATDDRCRFWWWLSIALYAKAMRTPWVLEGLDENTAYVGLGYAIDSKAAAGQHIVLGCSHLYNAQGQGLQFRLSRVENPTIRGGNPYLSFDDARRMGETIRSLYWDSHRKLPDRVVIHKLFPYRFDEQKGLRQGLQGVQELELLEINHESRLRYLSSRPTNRGFQDDAFPVRRGTAVRLADYEAVAWVHGATDAIRSNWTYFQGKRRIPGPVVIRRYAGRSSFATILNEILGLSKMDWNSGDLYSQLPATVQSSKAIAQIGSLLERFGRESYDYRLFM